MKKLLCLYLGVILLACGKVDDQFIPKLPSCLVLTEDIHAVRVQKVNGEWHYFLSSDNSFVDGPSYFINAKCDTVCATCGRCSPPECLLKYDENAWTTIW